MARPIRTRVISLVLVSVPVALGVIGISPIAALEESVVVVADAQLNPVASSAGVG